MAKQMWTWHHVTVFILTFFGYALFHVCRKSFSNVKNRFQEEFTPYNSSNVILPHQLWEKRQIYATKEEADEFCGALDSVFLFAYAIGLFISGFIGDRLNLRLLLSFGMCSSAIAMLLFGYVSQLAAIYSQYYYGALYFLCGILQSTGWPATVAIMANWFGKSARGAIFGLWSANASVGNIIGSAMVVSVLDYGFEYGVLMTSAALFCGGLVMLFCLIPSPEEVGLPSPSDTHPGSDNFVSNRSVNEYPPPRSNTPINANEVIASQHKAVSFTKALFLPGVIPYSLAYACIKLVNYSFFFWLPLYLVQGLHWQDATSDKLSNFYDVGGIVGGIVTGIITDLMGVRSPALVSMLTLSLGSMWWYSRVGAHYTYNVVIMTLTGFLLGGPANIVSSAISADLGQHESIKGNAMALATVTGIVDGTGSIGAAGGQFIIGVINKHLGWMWVFYFLIMIACLSILCISPMLVGDIRKLCRPKARYPIRGNMASSPLLGDETA